MKEFKGNAPKGDHLLAVLAALSNPPRLRVVAALETRGRNYISQLQLSHDGKAFNYFEVSGIATAVFSLHNKPES